MFALTHRPSPYMQACQRTFVDELPIDYPLACLQHDRYCDLLLSLGVAVDRLESNVELPDCAFIEDPAVILDEVAIMASMGAESRVGESLAIEAALAPLRELVHIEPPATLEGGDVLRLGRLGRTLLVGISSRTNKAGLQALAEFSHPFGYDVQPVTVTGSLHLKTALTELPDGRLLVNSNWIDIGQLTGYDLIDVPADEPWGANTLPIGDQIVIPAAHTKTAEQIDQLGFDVHPVDISEFAKAEGGVTCLSLVIADS